MKKQFRIVTIFSFVLFLVSGLTASAQQAAKSTAAAAATNASASTTAKAKPKPPTPTNNASDAEIAAAKASGKVWVNMDSKVYHKGGRWYGKTKDGKFMTEAEAKKAGYTEARAQAGKKA